MRSDISASPLISFSNPEGYPSLYLGILGLLLVILALFGYLGAFFGYPSFIIWLSLWLS